jgi:carbon-monoxide dehydrogenase medium subunit
MIPSNFEYVVAGSLEDAVRLLARHGSEARLLSGGHSLVPLMKVRMASPSVLIDVGRIPELRLIHEEENEIVVGAMATHHVVESSPLIQGSLPLLAETASQIGDVQVRNRGTIGGSLVHADPASDLPAAILALDAVLVVAGVAGTRRIPAESFFVDMLQSAVAPGEVLAEIRIPKPGPRTGSAYLKMAQSASGFAIVGVAARVSLDGEVCSDIRVGVTGVAVKPFRAHRVEDALRGRRLDSRSIRRACSEVAQGADVLSDIHASADYRTGLADVYTRRSLEAAAARAGGLT